MWAIKKPYKNNAPPPYDKTMHIFDHLFSSNLLFNKDIYSLISGTTLIYHNNKVTRNTSTRLVFLIRRRTLAMIQGSGTAGGHTSTTTVMASLQLNMRTLSIKDDRLLCSYHRFRLNRYVYNINLSFGIQQCPRSFSNLCRNSVNSKK